MNEIEKINQVVIRAENTPDFTTLTSLVDYVKAKVDRDKTYEYCNLFLHIISPLQVVAFEKESGLDGKNTYICRAKVNLPEEIEYGRFYSSENFNILLQSRFCKNETTAKLLSIVGNIKTSNVQTKSDNCITQTVTTNRGVVLKKNTELPNPVVLAPFRTFVEIEQIASAFVFRARESGREDEKGISFALFEADGGAWKLEATQRIKAYLEDVFKDTDVVILA